MFSIVSHIEKLSVLVILSLQCFATLLLRCVDSAAIVCVFFTIIGFLYLIHKCFEAVGWIMGTSK